MKITIFIGGLNNGGAERVACNLANYLVVKGHSVDMLTISETENHYYLRDEVHIHNLLKINERRIALFGIFKRLVRYLCYILFKRRDVYVVMLPFTTTLMLSTRKLISGKVIAAERANPSTYDESVQNKLQRLACRADGWVFQTNEQKEWYEPSIKGVNHIIIPNAINESFLKDLPATIKKKIIICSGRLIDQKNHNLLIKAFSKISHKYPDYQLHIYGEGSKRQELELLIEELRLKDKVFLPGYTDNIQEKLLEASMFVLSSDYEGMPNALIEAMALGLPCVSTDCGGGGARFLIANGVNGLLVTQNDVSAMAIAMDQILANESYARNLGNEARNVCQRLAPDTIYGEWESFIMKIEKECNS